MLFFCKCARLMDCYMVCLAAPDLVLGIIPGGMMRISLIVKILCVDLYDRPGYYSCLGVPFYMVAWFKFMRHNIVYIFPASQAATSASLLEKPHSLSYQEAIERRLPIFVVSGRSIREE